MGTRRLCPLDDRFQGRPSRLRNFPPLRGIECSATAIWATAADGFARAVARAGPDVNVLDRTDLHHRYGRLLVATGRRRDGTEELHRARALLAAADPFLVRVEADLAAAGLRPPRHAPRSPLGLTDRERDVVALVAGGMSNREAAAELYVSAKAVEYHLGNVDAKLGIRSRRELRDLVREPQAVGFPRN